VVYASLMAYEQPSVIYGQSPSLDPKVSHGNKSNLNSDLKQEELY
jgi:hypothetical protein